VKQRFKLQITQGIPAGGSDIALHIHPEGQHHVYNDGRTKRKKGYVHKPHAYTGSSNPHALANSGTHAKGLPFNKILQAVHTTNIGLFEIAGSKGALNSCSLFSTFAQLFRQAENKEPVMNSTI
jgi:hypothetical protein